MKTRYIIYIIVAIICVVAIVAGVYYQVFSEKTETPPVTNEVQQPTEDTDVDDPEILVQEFYSLLKNTFYDQGYSTSSIKKYANLEEEDIVCAAYNFKEEKDEKYSVNINLPAINIDSEVTAGFNDTTNKVFSNKAADVLFNSEKYTIYNVDYVAYLNDKILSVVIKSTLKEGNSAQRVIVQTYNYNIETEEAVTLNEILQERGIAQKDVNKKIEKQVKEAAERTEAIAAALASQGQTVYERDINNAMYVTDNVNHFFLGEDGQLYILYPYGNNNFTSEIDVIKID